MKIDFALPERIAGVAAENAAPGTMLRVVVREGLTSLDGALLPHRLETLHSAVFGHIPGLPHPSTIDHILVIIRPDLSGTAHINELRPKAMVKANKAIAAGQAMYRGDIADMASFDLGVDVPRDCAFVLVHSFGWRKGLFYDLAPLGPAAAPRDYDIKSALARQVFTLLTGAFDHATLVDGPASKPQLPVAENLGKAISRLCLLLDSHCEDEARYQEFFEQEPWVFGGQYKSIERHTPLDDSNIPDFTGVRARDGNRDIFELKQPFLRCFRNDGKFTSEFNEAWNQGIRYLDFSRTESGYLKRKGLSFTSANCFVVVGFGLAEDQLKRIHALERNSLGMVLLTYENVLQMAESFVALARKAGELPPGGVFDLALAKQVALRR